MAISGCDFDVQVSAVGFAQVEVFGVQCIGRGDSYFSMRRKRARRGGDKKRKIGKNKENGESRGCGRTCARATSRMGGCYSGI